MTDLRIVEQRATLLWQYGGRVARRDKFLAVHGSFKDRDVINRRAQLSRLAC